MRSFVQFSKRDKFKKRTLLHANLPRLAVENGLYCNAKASLSHHYSVHIHVPVRSNGNAASAKTPAARSILRFHFVTKFYCEDNICTPQTDIQNIMQEIFFLQYRQMKATTVTILHGQVPTCSARSVCSTALPRDGWTTTGLTTVPYCNNTDYEGHYQQLMYIVFSILTNYRMDVEQHTHTGRIGIVIRTKSRIEMQ